MAGALVLRVCRHVLANEDDAEDVCQTVAVRAWRGYGRYRGDAAFSTWVLAIARREIARALAVRARRRAVEEPEAPADPPANGPTECQGPADGGPGHLGLRVLLERALREGWLSVAEYRVVSCRLSHGAETWDQIGARLGATGGQCAVVRCRAVAKLRAFLFCRAPDVLGGIDELARAYALSLAAQADRLSPAEERAFRRNVLESGSDRRDPRGSAALRSACGKVVRHLPRP